MAIASLMPLPKYQAIANINGVLTPINNGYVYAYIAGTTTLKDTYTTADGTTPNANPVRLNARGEASIFLGAGDYDIKLCDASNVEIWKQLNVRGSATVRNFTTYAQILANSGFQNGEFVNTIGYYTSGDGGGNSFYWDSTSTATHNGGTVIKPTAVSGAGRWLAVDTDIVKVEQFGAYGNGLSRDDVLINVASEYCRVNGKTLVGTKGNSYKIEATVNLNCDADFGGCTFVSASTYASSVVSVSAAVVGVNILYDLRIVLPKIINNRVIGTVPIAASVGVYLRGLINATITFNKIEGFETNVLLYSTDTNSYISYCNFYFNSRILGSKYNVHLLADSTGWINQCSWFGGQFAQYSTDTAAFNTTNFKFTKSAVGGNNPPNGHSFFGCSMEGAFTKTIHYDYNTSVSFYSINQWFNCRFEAAAEFEFNQYALYDNFYGCNGIDDATFTGSIIPNMIAPRRFKYFQDVAPITGAAGCRTSTNLALFSATNSGAAMAIATGFGANVNACITSVGNYQHFYNANPALLWPLVEINSTAGLPKITFGDGTIAPATSITFISSGILRTSANFMPSIDNTYHCGNASYRWTYLAAASGTIVTSDERTKTDIQDIDNRVFKAWANVKFCQYRRVDSIAKKGDKKARVHFGLVAQQIKKAFEDEGLNAFDYGVLCYETVDDEREGIYGVRYDEAFALEIAMLRSIKN